MVVDSVFGLRSRDFLIKSGQEDLVLWGTTRAAKALAALLDGQATLLRQLSEHAVQMVQAQFPTRPEDDSQLEEFGERKFVLHLMVLLCDHQAVKVKKSQILKTLMSRTEVSLSHNHEGC